MKALLLLIFIPAIMQGQKKDSTIGKVDTIDVSKWVIGDSGTAATNIGTWTNTTIATTGYNFTITPKNDTIRVIMFYVDTTYLKSLDTYATIYNVSPILTELSFHAAHYVLWQFGYEIYAWEKGIVGFPTRKYLDADKKPLPKSLIVFQSINL